MFVFAMLSLFLISFVSAAQYSATTSVDFNSTEERPILISEEVEEDSNLFNNILATISLILVIVAIVMLHNLKKKKAKVKKKVSKKVQKKIAKKKN